MNKFWKQRSVFLLIVIFVILMCFMLGILIYFAVPKFDYFVDDEPSIDVIFATDESSLMPTLAAVNSVASNAKGPVTFRFITNEESVTHLRNWIEQSQLSGISYRTTTEFDKIRRLRNVSDHMQYARVFLAELFPDIEGRAIFLENDVIVLDDIRELAQAKIKENDYGAFPNNCLSFSYRYKNQNSMSNFLNTNDSTVIASGIHPSACSFGTGVFVADLATWRENKFSERFLRFFHSNAKKRLISPGYAGKDVTPLFMLTEHEKISNVEPLWHVDHLGYTTGSQYNTSFLMQSKLLHWNGRFKPWKYTSVHMGFWDAFYVQDPTGQTTLIRKP